MKPRLVVPFVVVGAMAVGGVAGAVIGVPGLSGAANSTTTAPNNKAPGPNGPHARGAKAELDAAAQALHLTTDELEQKLSDRKTTIADIAKQQNVDINAVTDAMVGAASAQIDQAVKDNKLPTNAATNAKSHLKDMITKLVNGEMRNAGAGGFGRGFRGHPGAPA